MSLMYKLKVRLLKSPRVNRLWQRWQICKGGYTGSYDQLPKYIRQYAKGRSFLDVGCMWGVNGEYAFIAEDAGATQIKGIDVFGPTPEFEEKKRQRQSKVEFILGDATDIRTINRAGQADIVFCAGVLYHHPAPYDLLVALRKMCREHLILRTSTIPEVPGLPNVAVYWPNLGPKDRELWNLKRLGLMRQVGITEAFQPEEGYGNWFWGLSPSCLKSMLRTAGFKVEWEFSEAFAQTVICAAAKPAMQHELPGEAEARDMARRISAARIAQPA
ncbi:MAG TPA: class I SAM-dependent methyltransferase [Tepidisphaeraceae bacterium]|nr:class I SAM-dependent methyltransferase [Tepidisphaeraceae bacterium]